MKNSHKTAGYVIAWLLIPGSLCAANSATPVFPGADWQRASPASQDVDPAKLKQAVVYMDANFGKEGAGELVIVRNGYMIWKGPASDSYHNIWSATKNFTSTVLGLLIADGKCKLDDFAVKYVPGLADRYPAYAQIRLRNLASMSAGYRGNVVNVSTEQPWGEPIHYLEPVAPIYEAGTQVQYNDHEVHLLGSILARLAGASEKTVFKRRIADPIGMTRWDWGVSGERNGVELNNAAGTPNPPGIQTTACELARFGLLYLNRGNWKGKQLLPAAFVDEAVRNQVGGAGKSWFLYGRYGLYWWTNDVRPDGTRPWPSAPAKAYTTNGRGANFCYVIPDWNMVVARTGTISVGSVADRSGRQDKLWDTFLFKLGAALGR